jgi:hypothetical protein
MKNDSHPHRSPDTFRIILVLAGLILSISIIVAQIPSISLSASSILITLGVAGAGAILSTVSAKRISVRIGKEPLAKIFISFSYSNTKFVDKLTYELTQRGFGILRADHALMAGDVVNEKITELLYEADFLIVIISNKSIQSESVLNETVFFKERGQKIFPLLIEKIEQSSKLSDILGEIQFVSFTTNFNEGLKKLIYSLEENATKIRNKQKRNDQESRNT